MKYLMIMRVTKVAQTADTAKENTQFFVVKGIIQVAIAMQTGTTPITEHACYGNAYGYCCAYSALCLCGDNTWGVAPGYKLLRLQRALITGASRKMKRPAFTMESKRVKM